MTALRFVVFSVLRGRGEAGRVQNHVLTFKVSVRAPCVPLDSTTPRRAAPPSLRAPTTRVPPDSTTPRRAATPPMSAPRVPPEPTVEPVPLLVFHALQDHGLTSPKQSRALPVLPAPRLRRKQRPLMPRVLLVRLATTAPPRAVPCAALARLDTTAPRWTTAAAISGSRARLAHTRSIPLPATKPPAANARRALFVPTTAPSPRSRATHPVARSLRFLAYRTKHIVKMRHVRTATFVPQVQDPRVLVLQAPFPASPKHTASCSVPLATLLCTLDTIAQVQRGNPKPVRQDGIAMGPISPCLAKLAPEGPSRLPS